MAPSRSPISHKNHTKNEMVNLNHNFKNISFQLHFPRPNVDGGFLKVNTKFRFILMLSYSTILHL